MVGIGKRTGGGNMGYSQGWDVTGWRPDHTDGTIGGAVAGVGILATGGGPAGFLTGALGLAGNAAAITVVAALTGGVIFLVVGALSCWFKSCNSNCSGGCSGCESCRGRCLGDCKNGCCGISSGACNAADVMNCSGNCLISCASNCVITGPCTISCLNSCLASCYVNTACTNGCRNICYLSCADSCQSICRYSCLVGGCSFGCKTTCYTSCMYTCLNMDFDFAIRQSMGNLEYIQRPDEWYANGAENMHPMNDLNYREDSYFDHTSGGSVKNSWKDGKGHRVNYYENIRQEGVGPDKKP